MPRVTAVGLWACSGVHVARWLDPASRPPVHAIAAWPGARPLPGAERCLSVFIPSSSLPHSLPDSLTHSLPPSLHPFIPLSVPPPLLSLPITIFSLAPPLSLSLPLLSIFLSFSPSLPPISRLRRSVPSPRLGPDVALQTGRYAEAVPHLQELLHLDVSDPLCLAPMLLEGMLRCHVIAVAAAAVPSAAALTATSLQTMVHRFETVHAANPKWRYTVALAAFAFGASVTLPSDASAPAATTSPAEAVSATEATAVPTPSPSEPLSADVLLQRALASNPHVPPLLCGERCIDGASPSSVGPRGSEEEAVAIASSLFDVWTLVSGAAPWCARISRAE